MRGRNRNNKGPNPLTRSYDSNGPDVKIRGTAQHIADKYAQLARDAQVSGDPVAAENYFQHAEHYYRLIAAAQEQFRPAFGAYQRPFDDDADEGEDEAPAYGYGQGERAAQGAQVEDDFGSQPQPFEGRPDTGSQRGDRGRQDGNRQDRGERFDRGERYDRNDQRADNGRYDRQDRGDRYERGDRQDGNRQDGNRQDRGERRDRFARGERQTRGEFQPRPDSPRPEAQRPESAPPRDDVPRRERQREEAETGDVNGLPAFLTNPARPAITVEAGAEPAFAAADETGDGGAAEANGRYPRRRRRRRVEPGESGALPGEGADTAAE